jgi:hypothetical protein
MQFAIHGMHFLWTKSEKYPAAGHELTQVELEPFIYRNYDESQAVQLVALCEHL